MLEDKLYGCVDQLLYTNAVLPTLSYVSFVNYYANYISRTTHLIFNTLWTI